MIPNDEKCGGTRMQNGAVTLEYRLTVSLKSQHIHPMWLCNHITLSLTGGLEDKESACNTGDWDSIPVTGRSPGEGNGYTLQYSCLDNPIDRGAWRLH